MPPLPDDELIILLRSERKMADYLSKNPSKIDRRIWIVHFRAPKKKRMTLLNSFFDKVFASKKLLFNYASREMLLARTYQSLNIPYKLSLTSAKAKLAVHDSNSKSPDNVPLCKVIDIPTMKVEYMRRYSRLAKFQKYYNTFTKTTAKMNVDVGVYSFNEKDYEPILRYSEFKKRQSRMRRSSQRVDQYQPATRSGAKLPVGCSDAQKNASSPSSVSSQLSLLDDESDNSDDVFREPTRQTSIKFMKKHSTNGKNAKTKYKKITATRSEVSKVEKESLSEAVNDLDSSLEIRPRPAKHSVQRPFSKLLSKDLNHKVGRRHSKCRTSSKVEEPSSNHVEAEASYVETKPTSGICFEYFAQKLDSLPVDVGRETSLNESAISQLPPLFVTTSRSSQVKVAPSNSKKLSPDKSLSNSECSASSTPRSHSPLATILTDESQTEKNTLCFSDFEERLSEMQQLQLVDQSQEITATLLDMSEVGNEISSEAVNDSEVLSNDLHHEVERRHSKCRTSPKLEEPLSDLAEAETSGICFESFAQKFHSLLADVGKKTLSKSSSGRSAISQSPPSFVLESKTNSPAQLLRSSLKSLVSTPVKIAPSNSRKFSPAESLPNSECSSSTPRTRSPLATILTDASQMVSPSEKNPPRFPYFKERQSEMQQSQCADQSQKITGTLLEVSEAESEDFYHKVGRRHSKCRASPELENQSSDQAETEASYTETNPTPGICFKSFAQQFDSLQLDVGRRKTRSKSSSSKSAVSQLPELFVITSGDTQPKSNPSTRLLRSSSKSLPSTPVKVVSSNLKKFSPAKSLSKSECSSSTPRLRRSLKLRPSSLATILTDQSQTVSPPLEKNPPRLLRSSFKSLASTPVKVASSNSEKISPAKSLSKSEGSSSTARVSKLRPRSLATILTDRSQTVSLSPEKDPPRLLRSSFKSLASTSVKVASSNSKKFSPAKSLSKSECPRLRRLSSPSATILMDRSQTMSPSEKNAPRLLRSSKLLTSSPASVKNCQELLSSGPTTLLPSNSTPQSIAEELSKKSSSPSSKDSSESNSSASVKDMRRVGEFLKKTRTIVSPYLVETSGKESDSSLCTSSQLRSLQKIAKTRKQRNNFWCRFLPESDSSSDGSLLQNNKSLVYVPKKRLGDREETLSSAPTNNADELPKPAVTSNSSQSSSVRRHKRMGFFTEDECDSDELGIVLDKSFIERELSKRKSQDKEGARRREVNIDYSLSAHQLFKEVDARMQKVQDATSPNLSLTAFREALWHSYPAAEESARVTADQKLQEAKANLRAMFMTYSYENNTDSLDLLQTLESNTQTSHQESGKQTNQDLSDEDLPVFN